MHSRALTDTLDYLIAHSPPTLRFVIASRQVPGLPLFKYRMRGDLFMITGKDLEFTRAEIGDFFKKVHLIRLQGKELTNIEKHSEGWAASLQLIRQSYRDDTKGRFDRFAHPAVGKAVPDWQTEYFNFFAQEIYNREPEPVRRFMVECSVLEWLTPEICNALTNRRDAHAVLKTLEARNAFLYRLSGNTYRFHNLFRDFLATRFTDNLEKRRIHRRIGRYLLTQGRPDHALYYFAQAKDFKNAVVILKKIGRNHLLKGKSRELCTVLDELPLPIMEREPELLDLYGYAQMLDGNTLDARRNIEKAIRLYRAAGRTGVKPAEAYYDLGFIHYNTGDHRRALVMLDQAIRLLPKSETLTHAAIFNSLGIIHSRTGGARHESAIAAFERAQRIVRRFPANQGLEASILNNWAMAERKAGNMENAWIKSRQAVSLLQKESNYSPQCGIIFYNCARFGLYRGETAPARQVLNLGERVARKFNDRFSLAIIDRGHAICQEELGNPGPARECLRRILTVFEGFKADRVIMLIHQDLGRINTKLGRLDEAEQNFAKAWAIIKSRDDTEAVSLLTAEAGLKIARKEWADAERMLTEASALAEKSGLGFEQFNIWLELARVDIARNGEPADLVAQILHRSRVKDYGRILAEALKNEPGLAKLALQADKDYVLTLTPKMPWIGHLVEISLFGDPKVTIDGRQIDPGSWTTAKALKLFCYLGYHRGPINRDILIEAFWPETGLSAGSLNLRKAVQHARETLAKAARIKTNPILYRNKHYRLAENFLIRIDTEEFNRLTGQAKKIPAPDPQVRQFLVKAVNLYRDGLAAGWYEDWIARERDQYRQKFEECLVSLAAAAGKRSDHPDATQWLRKLCDIDPLEEGYRRRLWQNLAELKKINEIREDYLKLTAALKKELNTGPQPETEKLFHALIK
jgi:ATP/maltotriose-dependent transcriptional regulator MalT/DNA-binding SARP family transcriptional activator